MRKKITVLAGIGFVAGAFMGNLIAFRTGGTLVNARLLEWTGSEAVAILLQSLLSGLMGAVAMAGVELHEIERWPMALSAAVHWLLIEAVYVPVALGLGWVENGTELLIMVSVQLVVYLIIWVIMYLRWRAQVKELNQLLKESGEREKD